MKAIFNWSGGKDSALALYHCLNNPDIEIAGLLTTVNAVANRVSMHGVRRELLQRQALEIGLPLYEVLLPEMPDMATYNETMRKHLQQLKTLGITHAVFGDIFLEDLRAYRDERLAEVGMTSIYPLWKRDTHELVNEFMSLGFGTVIACTQAGLDEFVGKELTPALINSLPAGVDVCGENGEFHTFSFKGPIFKNDMSYRLGEKVFKTYTTPQNIDASIDSNMAADADLAGYWYIDILLQ